MTTPLNLTRKEKALGGDSGDAGAGTGSNATDSNSLYAGIARSSIRTLALYFSRPVRLFRPSKASGWTSLRYAAQRDGASLTPKYITQHIKQHGLSVLPRHFVPPLIINTALGTLLFTSYTVIGSELTSSYPQTSSTLIAAVSGAGAGAIQALAGAPAENVRILMERGSFNHDTSVSGWRHAWREVFVDPANLADARAYKPVRMRLSDMREAKLVANELREMAGRGWNGWGWGLAKDVFGYGLFFAIFDVSRRAAIHTSHAIESMIYGQSWTVKSIVNSKDDYAHANNQIRAPTIARVAQGTVLVTGGVIAGIAYEYAGRPFDILRREWHIYSAENLAASSPTPSSAKLTPTTTSSHSPSPSTPHSAPPASHPPTQTAIARLRPDKVPPLPMLIQRVYSSGGIRAFFMSPASPSAESSEGVASTVRSWQSRVYPLLRTLGRVGPWGVGFLVWEAYGPGIQ
ncbi:hypothetical protein DL93DRAFT_571776 [Clavulina sp. PMI_390]|nr:hypothetical protein DL93DRAFT_571776 [Clavulina sp. PMI_390]